MKKRQFSNIDKFVICSMFLIVALIAFSISCFASTAGGKVGAMLSLLASKALVMAIVVAVITLIFIFYSNHYYKGLKYGMMYTKISYKLRRNLIDANYYEVGFFGDIKLPKMKLILNDNLSEGIIKISNSIHFDKALKKENISSALGEYVIDRYYLSNDQNWYVYEIYDHRTMKPKIIHDYAEFKKQSNMQEKNHLFLDHRNSFKMQSMLIVGQTGSGKTYMLYDILLQMYTQSENYILSFADPKRSSLYVLGERIGLTFNSFNLEDIIKDLKKFHGEMMKRSYTMEALLGTRLDADYADFGLPAHVFVFDEYAAFASSLQLLTKEKRDQVNCILRDIVLMGRQLGFFIIIVMQKSDSTTIPTMIRDNLPLKVVLGNAEDTTYVTTFGNGIELPEHQFERGEGLYTCSGTVNTPKYFSVPTLDFDILEAFENVGNEDWVL